MKHDFNYNEIEMKNFSIHQQSDVDWNRFEEKKLRNQVVNLMRFRPKTFLIIHKLHAEDAIIFRINPN
jgi:hypothetical protein